MDPIQRANLPQAIADRIIELITTGELRLGERLPAQRQLAKQLGVGVSSLRESLQALTAMGLIQMQPGRGTFISDSSAGVVSRHAGLAALASTQDLKDLLETRLHLDSTIVTLACRRASIADLAEIRARFNDMQRAVEADDMAELERVDLAFHMAIADAAHNDVLVNLVRSVTSLISSQISATPFSGSILKDHAAILHAVEARDGPAAVAAVRQVIRTSATHLGVDDLES